MPYLSAVPEHRSLHNNSKQCRARAVTFRASIPSHPIEGLHLRTIISLSSNHRQVPRQRSAPRAPACTAIRWLVLSPLHPDGGQRRASRRRANDSSAPLWCLHRRARAPSAPQMSAGTITRLPHMKRKSSFKDNGCMLMSCDLAISTMEIARKKHVFGAVLAIAARNRQTAAALCGLFASRPAAAVGSPVARRRPPRRPAKDYQTLF